MPTAISKKTRNAPRILHLNLESEHFENIAAGTKRKEFREFKPYWRTRLANRDYDLIEFRNGYAPDARRMRVEFRGVSDQGRGKNRKFVIRLGRILLKPTRRALSRRPSESRRSPSRRSVARLIPKARSSRVTRQKIRSPQALRRVIGRLSPASPITDRFSKAWRKGGRRGGGQREQRVVWYRTQHEHWMGWLNGYSGPGAYHRKDHRRTAEFVYNHIVNPQMLIYLAEASRLPRLVVRQAARAALTHRTTMSSMSAAIRSVIPWSTVEEALTGKGRA